MFIEVITSNLKDSIEASNLNVDQIELITDLSNGGLTPDIALIQNVCSSVSTPVNIMLRCHANSFTYSEYDINLMLDDLEKIKKTKANGIVFGCLDKKSNIDEILLSKIIKNKGHLKLTFHRAIDQTRDYKESIKTLLKYDIDTILTSGHKNTAINGVNNIIIAQNIVNRKIDILAGSGINNNNVYDFIDKSKSTHIHLGTGARFDNKFENNFNKEFISNLLNYTSI